MKMTDLTLRSNLLDYPEGNETRTSTQSGLAQRFLGRFGRTCTFAFQLLHFLISMCYLWAGIVEFIRNPPYFDAYGDADSHIDLPSNIFEVNFIFFIFIFHSFRLPKVGPIYYYY